MGGRVPHKSSSMPVSRSSIVKRGQDQKAKEWEAVQRAFTGTLKTQSDAHWVERDQFKSFIGVLIVLNTFVIRAVLMTRAGRGMYVWANI